MSVQEFKEADKLPIIVILDNVRSMNNVGSAFRTADAFRIDHIFLTGITGKPPHREIQKTALGATESVSWQYFENTSQAIAEAKALGFTVLAVEQALGSTLLGDLEIKEGSKNALVFGNEVFGVEEAAMKLVDGCVEIPQFGTKHSLNISVSLGIVLWEFARGQLPTKP